MNGSKQSATALAVEVLDELRASILECLLALDAIGQESIVDLKPLAESLVVSGRVARQTFVAASLLHQDAELAVPFCEENRTAPGSIISRHLAAVAKGAVAISPDRSDVDDFEAEIGGLLFMVEERAPAAGALNVFGVVAVDNSGKRTGQGGQIGSDGLELSIEDDRDGYREALEKVLIDRRRRYIALRRDTVRSAGSNVVQQWMRRRASVMAENE